MLTPTQHLSAIEYRARVARCEIYLGVWLAKLAATSPDARYRRPLRGGSCERMTSRVAREVVRKSRKLAEARALLAAVEASNGS